MANRATELASASPSSPNAPHTLVSSTVNPRPERDFSTSWHTLSMWFANGVRVPCTTARGFTTAKGPTFDSARTRESSPSSVPAPTSVFRSICARSPILHISATTHVSRTAFAPICASTIREEVRRLDGNQLRLSRDYRSLQCIRARSHSSVKSDGNQGTILIDGSFRLFRIAAFTSSGVIDSTILEFERGPTRNARRFGMS